MIETLELQYFWKYHPTFQTFRDYQKLLDKSYWVLLNSKDNLRIPRSKYTIKMDITFFMNEILIRVYTLSLLYSNPLLSVNRLSGIVD